MFLLVSWYTGRAPGMDHLISFMEHSGTHPCVSSHTSHISWYSTNDRELHDTTSTTHYIMLEHKDTTPTTTWTSRWEAVGVLLRRPPDPLALRLDHLFGLQLVLCWQHSTLNLTWHVSNLELTDFSWAVYYRTEHVIWLRSQSTTDLLFDSVASQTRHTSRPSARLITSTSVLTSTGTTSMFGKTTTRMIYF